MKLYIVLALLPFVWTADVPTITCPDGNTCSVGKTCCQVSGHYECCDLPQSEILNKKLVLAHSKSLGVETLDQTVLHPPEFSCNGTTCRTSWCCSYDNASCCAGTSCCPNNHQCCGGDNYPKVWCCQSNQRCADSFMYCIAGAAAISPQFFTLLIILLGIVASKQFFSLK